MSLNYNTLDPNQKQIRLLTICPDKDGESPIRGFLQVVSLSDTPEFEALSYVWGDVTETEEVSIENCILDVTLNLANFLHALRHEEHERVVWVDYICINQDDTLEKNSQIPLMSEIYTSAHSVVAWLGELNSDIEEAVAYNDADEGRHTPRSTYWLDAGECEPRSIQETSERCFAMIRARNGIFDIFMSSYWSRLWTFQEWHLPEKRPICMCGRLAFDLRNMAQGYLILTSKISDMLMSRYEPGELDAKETQLVLNKSLDWANTSGAPDDMFSPDTVRERRNLSLNIPISDLIRFTSHRECSQPLDRIYALYAMAPMAQQKYPPDYRKTMEQVLQETMAYIINYDQDYNIFESFNFCNNVSLPSWVLDLTVDKEDRRTTEENRCINSIPEKALWQPAKMHAPHINEDLSTLRLWARLIGYTMKHTALSCESKGIYEIIDAFHRVIHSLVGFGDAHALSRTLVKACYNFTDSHNHFLEDYLYGLMDKPRTILGFDKKLDQHLDSTMSKLCGKSFFLISNNSDVLSIGIGDFDIQEGDQLIIPSGINQVFVLRECPDLSHENQPYFRIVGRVFVEGIAESQKDQPARFVEELKQRDFQEFLIR